MTDNDEDADMSLGKVLRIWVGIIPREKHFLECGQIIKFTSFRGQSTSRDCGDPKNYRMAENPGEIVPNMDYFFAIFEK